MGTHHPIDVRSAVSRIVYSIMPWVLWHPHVRMAKLLIHYGGAQGKVPPMGGILRDARRKWCVPGVFGMITTDIGCARAPGIINGVDMGRESGERNPRHVLYTGLGGDLFPLQGTVCRHKVLGSVLGRSVPLRGCRHC